MNKCFLLLFFCIAFIVSGCKKTTEQIVVAPGKTVFVTVDQMNWGSIDTKKWVAGISVPELQDNYVVAGATLAYRETSSNNYEQWPLVYKGISYSYSVRKGQIIFDVESADGQTPITRPEAMKFKLVLLDTQ